MIALGTALAIAAVLTVYIAGRPVHTPPTQNPSLATRPGSYIGVYTRDPFAGVKSFTAATGVKPRIVVYYSGWLEPFRTSFATTAAAQGEVPLVQINPAQVSMTAIADGTYDSYLRTFADAIRANRAPVIVSFGHEMNGWWYSWGYTHTASAAFVAAWRHIVTLFRSQGVRNVTWLWTVNTIQHQTRGSGVPSPNAWWPGSSYVNWIGMDGYYTTSSSVFSTVFGPTIADVRALTHDPILIAETSAAPTADQSEKITNLFAGVHLYGVLGFVWFDAVTTVDWRLTSPQAIKAFRLAAQAYHWNAS